jgi:transcriptional regulator with XRE-family HTH domain
MLTNKQIEQFYKDVDILNLKYPVAEIARATKESKGNISRILNKKAEPSEAFLKKFYKSFEIVPHETGDIKNTSVHDKLISFLEKAHNEKDKTIERQEAVISALRKAVDKIDFIDNRVKTVEATVSDLTKTVSDVDSTLEDLREYVLHQVAKLRKESHAKVLSEMSSGSVEQLRQDRIRGIRSDSGK